jgi:predicted PurR-regulated permease PerM
LPAEHEATALKRDTPVSRYDLSALLLLFLVVLGIGLAFGMLGPYLDAILMAGIFAIIMNPIHQRLLALSGGRRSLAALLTSLLLTTLVVIPAFSSSGRSFKNLLGYTRL